MNSCVKIKNNDMIKADDILDLIFTKEQKERFIKSFIFVCDYYFSKKKKIKYLMILILLEKKKNSI